MATQSHRETAENKARKTTMRIVCKGSEVFERYHPHQFLVVI